MSTSRYKGTYRASDHKILLAESGTLMLDCCDSVITQGEEVIVTCTMRHVTCADLERPLPETALTLNVDSLLLG